MTGVDPARDWQQQSVTGLAGLTPDRVPAVEILFLDALAAHLLGPDAPVAPYTVEHASVIAGHLLRAFVSCASLELDGQVDAGPEGDQARAAILDGAHAFAERKGPGVQQLVTRYLGAVVGELEIHAGSPDEQVRSLFYFGLLAVASGPGNRLSQVSADGIAQLFIAWNDQIGAGFVPPWRVSS